MKAIALEKSETLFLNLLTPEHLIGIMFPEGQDKGFILKSEEGYGVLSVSEGNCFNTAYKANTLEALIERLEPAYYNQKWFVFDNMVELYKWLGSNE